jgi:hypothetical protein
MSSKGTSAADAIARISSSATGTCCSSAGMKFVAIKRASDQEIGGVRLAKRDR